MTFKLSFSSETIVPAESAPTNSGYYAVKDSVKLFLIYAAGAYSWCRLFPRIALEQEGTTSFNTIQLALQTANEEGYTVYGFDSEAEILRI